MTMKPDHWIGTSSCPHSRCRDYRKPSILTSCHHKLHSVQIWINRSHLPGANIQCQQRWKEECKHETQLKTSGAVCRQQLVAPPASQWGIGSLFCALLSQSVVKFGERVDHQGRKAHMASDRSKTLNFLYDGYTYWVYTGNNKGDIAWFV